MPVSEDEFRNPRFIKYQDRYPLSYNKKAKFTDTIVNPKVYQGRANGGGWKPPGYNPNHNSATPETVNLTTENPTFKSY